MSTNVTATVDGLAAGPLVPKPWSRGQMMTIAAAVCQCELTEGRRRPAGGMTGLWISLPVEWPQIVPDSLAIQAAKQPDKPALICESQVLTYRAYDERSRRAARCF